MHSIRIVIICVLSRGHPKPRAALAACLRRPDPRPPRPLPRRDVPVLYLLSDAVSLSHTPKSFYLYLLIPHNLANVASLYWGAISFPKTIYVQYSVPNIFISCISSSEQSLIVKHILRSCVGVLSHNPSQSPFAQPYKAKYYI